jgi:hypothetical protein
MCAFKFCDKVMHPYFTTHTDKFKNNSRFEKRGSQFVTSNSASKMGLRRPPYAFTEQGMAMLSSVLNSDRAVEVNIAVMRAFVRLREIMPTHKELARKLNEIERKLGEHDEKFAIVFEAIRQLMISPAVPAKPRIGFHQVLPHTIPKPKH